MAIIGAVEPGNKHQEDTTPDVAVAVVETELTENPLTEEAINNGKSKEEEEDKTTTTPSPSTSDRHRRHSSIDAPSLKFLSKRSSNMSLLQRQKNKKSLNSPHPVKHCQVRVTERGQKATCTLLTLEMPRLIEANHHSA